MAKANAYPHLHKEMINENSHKKIHEFVTVPEQQIEHYKAGLLTMRCWPFANTPANIHNNPGQH